MDPRQNFIDGALATLRRHKALAEGAIEQLTDEQFDWAPDPEASSVAILVGHMAGNLRSRWEAGWATLLAAIEPLGPTDLERSAPMRGQQHTVVEALLRQLAHHAYHVGQIVQLARQQVGAERWRSLSIPKGQSEAYRLQGRI